MVQSPNSIHGLGSIEFDFRTFDLAVSKWCFIFPDWDWVYVMCLTRKKTTEVLDIPVILSISFALFGRYQKCLIFDIIPYCVKFLRHVYFAVLRCAYSATLNSAIWRKFCILNHLNFAFLSNTLFFCLGNVTCPWSVRKPILSKVQVV